jgi:(S)-2-hydroxyglutarate dehydrogenase
MTLERDIVVIGGGIVGLSTAMALARGEPPKLPLVLEKEAALASHQTGHNSGVIHSGLYYRPGSLKARYTVDGARRLVEFCREHGLPHQVCGKVVVATSPEEVSRLHEIHPRAQANGVPGVELIGPGRLREIEPAAAGLAALLVPGTGIVDYTAVAQRYADLVCAAGGEIRTQAQVLGIRRDGSTWVLETTTGTVRAGYLVNCAGLHSDRVARMAGIRTAVRIVPFRGEYYKLTPEREGLVRALIYPVPDPGFPFLGVHFTRMVRGGVEAGPNAVLSFKREGYRKTDFSARDAWRTFAYPAFWRLAFRYWRTGAGEFYRSFNKGAFVRALQRLLPDLRREDLLPGGSGVRAQAVDANGNLLDDFCIETGPGAIHVLNAPSPAATASLPIGETIAAQASDAFGW